MADAVVGPGIHATSIARVTPDLAVEVVSETNTANEIQEKLQDYFRCEVQLVWVIYPMQSQVFVYELPTPIKVLERADALNGR